VVRMGPQLSRWTYTELAASESFEALVFGLQGALWTLGVARGCRAP
jgi:hypothetical protein